MPNFIIRTTRHWKRFRDAPVQDEPRPHIMPVSEAAIAYLSGRTSTRLVQRVVGKLYAGYGYVQISDDRWVTALRFKTEDGLIDLLTALEGDLDKHLAAATSN